MKAAVHSFIGAVIQPGDILPSRQQSRKGETTLTPEEKSSARSSEKKKTPAILSSYCFRGRFSSNCPPGHTRPHPHAAVPPFLVKIFPPLRADRGKGRKRHNGPIASHAKSSSSRQTSLVLTKSASSRMSGGGPRVESASVDLALGGKILQADLHDGNKEPTMRLLAKVVEELTRDLIEKISNAENSRP